MNLVNRAYLILILLACALKGYPQVTALGSKKDFFRGSTSLESVRLNPASLAFVSNDSDKAVDINCTDNNFNSKWSARVDGYLQNSSVLGSNLIVVVSTGFTFFTRANSTFKAYLLDAETGKVIRERIIFEGNNDYLTLPYFIASRDHKTFTMAIRQTAVKRNVKIAPGALAAIYVIKKVSDQAHQSKTFNVITLSDDLSQKEVLSPEIPDGQFVGIQRTSNNDLYTAVSDNKKGITISRFLPGRETPVKSVTEEYSFKTGWLDTEYLNDRVKFMADTINDHTVYLSGAFKNGEDFIMIFNKYDFATGKHKRFKKNYTNTEVKSLERTYDPVNKKFKKLSLASAGQLQLIDVVINKDGYFLVVSDFQLILPLMYFHNPPVERSEGLIIYNLDTEMNVKTISTVPRFYEGVKRAELKTYQKDDSFYVMAAHWAGGQFLLSKINTIDGKVEDISLISPKKASQSDFPALSAAIAFDKSIILPVLDYKTALAKTKFAVNIYRFGW